MTLVDCGVKSYSSKLKVLVILNCFFKVQLRNNQEEARDKKEWYYHATLSIINTKRQHLHSFSIELYLLNSIHKASTHSMATVITAGGNKRHLSYCCSMYPAYQRKKEKENETNNRQIKMQTKANAGERADSINQTQSPQRD